MGANLLRTICQPPVRCPQLNPFLLCECQVQGIVGFGVSKPIRPAKRSLIQMSCRCKAADVQYLLPTLL